MRLFCGQAVGCLGDSRKTSRIGAPGDKKKAAWVRPEWTESTALVRPYRDLRLNALRSGQLPRKSAIFLCIEPQNTVTKGRKDRTDAAIKWS
jgi:hypothetical protein